eukprot:Rmarinus@m.27635
MSAYVKVGKLSGSEPPEPQTVLSRPETPLSTSKPGTPLTDRRGSRPVTPGLFSNGSGSKPGTPPVEIGANSMTRIMQRMRVLRVFMKGIESNSEADGADETAGPQSNTEGDDNAIVHKGESADAPLALGDGVGASVNGEAPDVGLDPVGDEYPSGAAPVAVWNHPFLASAADAGDESESVGEG